MKVPRLSVRVRHALRVGYLVGLILVLGVANLLWTSHVSTSSQDQSRKATQVAIRTAIDENNRQWCDVLELLTSGRQPTSKQPGLVKLYGDFSQLEDHYGCKK